MEMENSLIQQMVNNQTTMLQQMQQMLSMQQMQQNTTNLNNAPASVATPVAPFAPLAGNPLYDMNAANAPGMSSGAFSSIAPISTQAASMDPGATPSNDGAVKQFANMYAQGVQFNQPENPRAALMQVLSNYIHNERMYMSPQGQTNFQANQLMMMNQGMLNMLGNSNSTGAGLLGAGAGALAGKFFAGGMGGLAGGLVVGGMTGLSATFVTDRMVRGAQNAMQYEDLLRRESYRFINPFESINEYGASGLKREETQDIARFLREVAPEKFMEDQDIQKILSGALENKLLKSVSDVDSFKKKFTSLVDAVKQITLTMDQSVEEAVKFMGEMNLRGISTDRQTITAAGIRTAASFAGVSASDMAPKILEASDRIVAGTTTNAAKTSQNVSEIVSAANVLSDRMKESNPEVYNFITNSGGATQVGLDYVERRTKALRDDQMMQGIFASAMVQENGQYVLNQQKLQEMLQSGKDGKGLMDEGIANMQRLSNGDPVQIALMQKRISSQITGLSNAQQEMAIDVMTRTYQKELGLQSPEMVLEQLGIASSYQQAQAFVELGNTYQQYDNNFAAQQARTAFGSEYTSKDAGFFQKANRLIRQKLGLPIEGIGQSAVDTLSNLMEDTGNFIQGIDQQGGGGVQFLTGERASAPDSFYSEEYRKNMSDSIGDLSKLLTPKERTNVALNTSSASFNYSYDPNSIVKDAISDMQDAFDLTKEQEVERTISARKAKEGMTHEYFDVAEGKSRTIGESQALIKQLEEERAKDPNSMTVARLEYLVNQDRGEYDGFLGTIRQGVDRVGIGLGSLGDDFVDLNMRGFAAVADFFTPKEDIGEFEEDSLTVVQQAEREKVNLQSKVKKLLLSDEFKNYNGTELSKLIEAGDVKSVSQKTGGNQKAIALAEQYQNQNKLIGETTSKVKGVQSLEKDAVSVAKSFGQLKEIAFATGLYGDDPDEAKEEFEDLTDMAQELIEDVKDKKLSPTQLADRRNELMTALGNKLDEEGSVVAEEMAMAIYRNTSYNPAFDPTQLYENGTFNMDRFKGKVQDYLSMSSGIPDGSASAGEKPSQQASNAMTEHAIEFGKIATLLHNEIVMMKDLREGRKPQVATSLQNPYST